MIADAGICCFHMTDFEANSGEFMGWEDRPDDRRNLLGSLLELIAQHTPTLMGFSNLPMRLDGTFKSTYGKSVVDAVVYACRDIAPYYGMPVSMVFAKHKEFTLPRIEQVFGAGVIDYGTERLGTCAVDDPCKLPALQAADIIAYELSRAQRSERPERYPLTFLKQRCERISLVHRIPSASSAWERG